VLVTKLILEATQALSNLNNGNVYLFKDNRLDAKATVSLLPPPDRGSDAAKLVRATVDSLEVSQTRLMSTESLNPGLDRSKRFFSLCPGSFGKLLDLLNELRQEHKYQKVVDACELRAFWAKHCGNFFPGTLRPFAPDPSVPVEMFTENDETASDGVGQSPDPLLSVEKVRRHATDTDIFHRELMSLYLIALHMTDQREKGRAALAGAAMNRDFEVSVLASLDARDTGDKHFRSEEYDAALKAFEASIDALFEHPAHHTSAHEWLKAIVDFKIGLCLSNQKKCNEAIDKLDQCLTCIPDHMEALQLRAACHHKLSRKELAHLDSAISDYESFVSKRDNAAARKFPSIAGIVFPCRVKESVYQGAKAKLEALKAKANQTPMADATNRSRDNRDFPTGSSD
jgi:tetratricopeptide (TPR) repeat protein